MSAGALEVARAHDSGRSFDQMNDLLVNALRKHADKILLQRWDGARYTGLEIEGEVARYVAALHKLGVGLGVPVALLAGNGVEVLFLQHAIGVLGGIFTPLHPLGSPSDFGYMLQDAGVDIVIVSKAREQEILRAVEISGRAPRIFTLGGGDANDLVETAGKEAAREIVLRPIDPEAICRIVYTGGTTGVPKASLASFRAMSTMFGIQLNEWQWPETIRHLLVAPLSHVGAVCFLPLLSGEAACTSRPASMWSGCCLRSSAIVSPAC